MMGRDLLERVEEDAMLLGMVTRRDLERVERAAAAVTLAELRLDGRRRELERRILAAKAAGASQVELARRAGLTQGRISQIVKAASDTADDSQVSTPEDQEGQR